MLKENTIFGVRDKVSIAIERLQEFEPKEGYYLAFSGGKDSVVIYRLAQMAKVNFDAHYNLTTVDPPELVRFIKTSYPDVAIDMPPKSMWSLIVQKGFPPTRVVRYCCAELKERGGIGRIVITGIRWEESYNRRKRHMVEQCQKYGSKHYVHPIIDWCSADVWEFIRNFNIHYCSLYDEGFKRLGCVMCPMGGRKRMELEALRWPKIKNGYLRAFDLCIKKKLDNGLISTQETADEMYDWWLVKARKKINENQYEFPL